MKKKIVFKRLIFLMIAAVIAASCYIRFLQFRTVPAMSAARFPGQSLIIDAGHGGEDGGAVSFSGMAESTINLAIALRFDAILGLYGVNTVLLRSEDVSLHDASGGSLRDKKVSDLHNRVALIDSVENATLISIHQNTFTDRKYSGAQVFYRNDEPSHDLARHTQETLRLILDPSNTREAAKIPTSVYLMNHIHCRAILVECGFISNIKEDKLLQDSGYQKKIAAALAGAYLSYQDKTTEGD